MLRSFGRQQSRTKEQSARMVGSRQDASTASLGLDSLPRSYGVLGPDVLILDRDVVESLRIVDMQPNGLIRAGGRTYTGRSYSYSLRTGRAALQQGRTSRPAPSSTLRCEGS